MCLADATFKIVKRKRKKVGCTEFEHLNFAIPVRRFTSHRVLLASGVVFFFCKYEVVLATDIRLLTQILIVLFQVYADASLVFPLLVAETFARNFKLDN